MYELIVTAVMADGDIRPSSNVRVFRYEFETEELLQRALDDMVRYTAHEGGELHNKCTLH